MENEQEDLVSEVDVDAAVLDAAERDVYRALILQNSRVATRFDIAGRYRTHKVEGKLLRFGGALCGLGVVLALVLVVGRGQSLGAVQPRDVLLLAILLAIWPLFKWMPEIRQRWLGRLDGLLARRAGAQFASLRAIAPVRLRYSIGSGRVRCEELADDAPRLRFERNLASSRYALRGNACIALFANRRKQNPNILIVVDNENVRTAVEQALGANGVEVEELQRDLLPETTVERSW